jgi:signal transduction histidine kinase
MRLPNLVHGSGANKGLPTYLLSVVLVLLFLWLRLQFDLTAPTLTLLTLPIILAGFWGGFGPGLLATATAVIGANYYLLPPIHSLAVAKDEELLQQAALATVGISISVICEYLHRARRNADEARVRAQAILSELAQVQRLNAMGQMGAAIAHELNLGLVGASYANITVYREYSPSLPRTLINRTQIQQVLINLIRNGIEAMAQSAQPTLTLTTGSEGNFAVISVRDTGPGLPAEVREKLFQPFVTTKERGMGIGLSVCQSIVESHGGKIQSPDNGEAGTEFRVFLPLDIHEAPHADENASVESDMT